jgi:hypothetical protein
MWLGALAVAVWLQLGGRPLQSARAGRLLALIVAISATAVAAEYAISGVDGRAPQAKFAD